jgi:uncharacterized SAM-binding protein YcdF (DUF218 family)
MMTGILFGLGVLFLLYYVVIVAYVGFRTEFGWFWSFIGISCMLSAVLLQGIDRMGIEIPRMISVPVVFLIFLGLLVFFAVEVAIIYHATVDPEDNADYVIVLGAQVRGRRITKSLKARLNTAMEYLVKNSDTFVIVSGGKGQGEAISEAEAMKGYLVEHGILEERIMMESQSTNTYENIFYSKRFIQGANKKIVIVSNGFHIYRSVRIAKKQKIGQVEGLSAPTDHILLVSYYVREVLAVMKDKLEGNI